MFTVLGIMFAGIAIGYLLKEIPSIHFIGKGITFTIYLLLFLLGVSVGSNEVIINNFYTLGFKSLLIALATTLGSVISAWFIWIKFFKKNSNNEK